MENQQVLYLAFQYSAEFAQDIGIQPGDVVGAVIIYLFPVHLGFVGQLIFAKFFLLHQF